MNNGKASIFYKITAVLVFLLLLLLMAALDQELFHAIVNGDIEAIRTAVAGNLLTSYLITFILMLIQNSFTTIPLILIITLNFTLFGFVNGFIWGWLSSLFAASIIYLCVKYLFRDQLQKKFKQELIDRIEEKGFSYVFKGRIFPFIPTSLVNILAGLSSIHFKDFFWATALGNFFYFFILTLIPAGFFSADMNHFVSGALFLLFIVIVSLLKRKNKAKTSSNKDGETSSF